MTIEFMFDGGLFLRDSLGNEIPHPEFYFTEIAELRRLSRAKSRKQPLPGQRGSKNYRKAKRALAKWHEHIANKRDAFLWPIARWYAENFRQIIVPKWPLKKKIQYAVTSKKAQRLCDASYGRFLSMLKQKCEEFGTKFDPRKDEEACQKEMDNLTEVAKREALSPILRKAKRDVRHNYRGRFKSLEKACERLTTLRI